MSSAWYKTTRWQKTRSLHLQHEPFCRYCMQRGITTAASVADHITPHRGDYELFWHGELQSLCAECHSGAKQQLEASGVLRGCDANGLPLDPGHHWKKRTESS